MKKIIALGITACMAASIIGCSTTRTPETAAPETTAIETEAAANMVNPLEAVTEQEMLEITGVTNELPDDCTDVQYYVLHAQAEEAAGDMSQIEFDYDGNHYTLRIAATEEAAGDMSGLFYTWTDTKDVTVGEYCEGVAQACAEAAEVHWFDVVPGISYSLGCTGNVSADQITTVAGHIFTPAQGEVG